jgi:hypothetical protein
MKTTNYLVLIVGILLLSAINSQAQIKIGENPTIINPSSILEIESTNKGILLPRIALQSTILPAPLASHVAGMIIYNTETAGTAPDNVVPGFYYNDGTRWLNLADLAVTNAKLADNAVTTAKIASGGNDKVLVTDNAGAVAWVDKTAFGAAVADMETIDGLGTSASKFSVKDNGITSAKILDGTIVTADLGNNSVSTDKIIDANVTESKLATSAVSTAKIAADAVTSAKILDGTIVNEDIADATITTSKISGTIAIANGGTGASTATGALTNLGAEAVANKSTAVDMGGTNADDVKYPTQLAVKTFVENSLNNTVGTSTQTALNLKEDLVNKSTATDLGAASSSNVLYPSQLAVKTYVDTKLSVPNAISSLTYLPNISDRRILGNTSGATSTPLEIPVTGTGDVVLNTSPSINAPAITSPVLNGTISGTAIVPVNQGGSGVNMSTTSGYVKQASIGANFTTVDKIPVGDVTGAVQKVNGTAPDATGNVSIAFGKVTTGTLAARPVSSTTNGDIYVVSADPTSSNDGRTFISDGTNWNEVTANQASLDARYLRLSGDVMAGNITMPTGKKIILTDAPSSATDAANKAYVDAQITAATPDATASATGKIQLAGDLSGTATLPVIGANKVTFAKMQTVSSNTILGRSSAGTGNIEELATLPVATLPAFSGDVTTSAGSAVTTIATNAVTLPKIQNLSAQSLLLGSKSSGGTGVSEITLGTGLSMSGNTLNSTGGTVTTVTGTTDRVTVTNGATTPAVDIAATYVGQSSITTLGTITTGTWNGTTISVPHGGTGATTLTGYVKGNGTAAMTASSTIPVADVTGAQTVANISTDGNFTSANDVNYPSQLAVKTYVDAQITAATPDATATATGKIQLAGDLAGTATAPEVGTGKITSAKIANAAVTTDKILDANVTPSKIAPGTANQILVTSGTPAAVQWVTPTNTLAATNGELVSTVNGLASTPAVNVLISANNGLTVTDGNVQLGGALTAATTITTDATKTLALAGLEAGANTDKMLVVNASGVVKSVDASARNINAIRKVTAAYTVTDADYTILADASSAFTLTLPAANANTGRVLIIRKIDETANDLTFSAAIKISETRDFTTLNMNTTIRIQSDGTAWYKID